MCSRPLLLAAALLALGSPIAAQPASQVGGRSANRCAAPTSSAETPRSPAAEALVRGNEHAGQERWPEALEAYAESERLARSVGDARTAALAAANAARTDLEAGRLEGLGARLDAILLGLESDGVEGAARAAVMLHVARTWERLATVGDGDRRALHRAAEILESADGVASRAGDRRLRSYALGWRGGLYERRVRLDDARLLTRRALLEGGAAEAPDAIYRWHWQLGRIEHTAGDTARAIESYRRAVAILDVVRSDLARGSADTALAFREEVAPVYLGLVDLLLAQAAGMPTDATRQPLLAEARDVLEAEKAAELRDHFRDECLAAQRKTTPDDVPGTVVVYPVLLADRVELIVSREGKLASYRAPIDGPTLEAEVRALRRLLMKRTTRQYLPRAQKLYDWLIRPIVPSLEGGRIQALLFVPGGALRTIPFAALHDRDSNQFLIEKLPVAVVPGLTLTDPRPIDPKQIELLAAGITQGIYGFPALANVDEELDDVTGQFPGERLQDESFDVAGLERAVAERPTGIVHIASHGEFRADASQSFLLAWDGPVPMDRIGDIVGQTRYRTDAPLELLTLSACQTAAGDDRAALGLAGVALQAGARSALATLWSVNDEASAELIATFYRRLAGGASRAVALQQAQLGLLAVPAYRHPAYWAPFLIISSWL